MPEQGTLFDERFLGDYVGSMMRDATTALVELVANCWDAYATEVDVTWPDDQTPFRVCDNGHGMTADELLHRWRTLSYNRLAELGEYVSPVDGSTAINRRKVFGRNGKGRFSGFYFSSPFQVRTWKGGAESTFEIREAKETPFEIEQLGVRAGVRGHGCEIYGVKPRPTPHDAAWARAVLSTRFLTCPDFVVRVNGVQVTFSDIPDECYREKQVAVPGHGEATIRVIDSQKADRTTKHHGIAWWVNNRLVGECRWHWWPDEKLLDGRREEAKRFTFIIIADYLSDALEADWSDFKGGHVAWRETQAVLQIELRDLINEITEERRGEKKAAVRKAYSRAVKGLPSASRERWLSFVDLVIDQCPSLTDQEVTQISGLLIDLERSQSQYDLLDKLHRLGPDNLDELNALLNNWTVRSAKEVLSLIEKRLRLIEEIKEKSSNPASDEVHDLQPLFHQGLWVLGPQFESIEFTSNQTMATVVQKLFKAPGGSQNRPDFVITPDSSIGFYSRPSFDESFNEDGVAELVVVELKRPGIPIKSEQVEQAWKYIDELIDKGLVKRSDLAP